MTVGWCCVFLDLFICSKKSWSSEGLDNPTSPLGDRWSRAFVKSPSQHPFNPISSNFPWRRGLPLLLPPPRAPKLAGRSHSWSPICDHSAIQVIIVFSSFFQHHFMLILARCWTQLGSKIAQKSIPRRNFSNSETASDGFQDFAIPP